MHGRERGREREWRDCGTISYSVFAARYRIYLTVNDLCCLDTGRVLSVSVWRQIEDKRRWNWSSLWMTWSWLKTPSHGVCTTALIQVKIPILFNDQHKFLFSTVLTIWRNIKAVSLWCFFYCCDYLITSRQCVYRRWNSNISMTFDERKLVCGEVKDLHHNSIIMRKS